MIFRCLLYCALGCVLIGCGGETKPRSVEEINAERQTLPGLFITASGQRIEAPRDSGVFVDEASGELAWPAYACTNPDCPGRNGEVPHLFIWSDPRFYVAEDGTLGTRQFNTAQEYRDAAAQAGTDRQPTCNECLKIRNLETETPEEGQKYSEYPRQYVLPATRQRELELDAEHQERIEYIEARIRAE